MKWILTALLSLWAVPVAAQDPVMQEAPITIGMSHLLGYGPGDQREVNIYLPQGYSEGGEYPVLYLLDGGIDQDFLHVAGTTALNALWGRSQPVIVVGVQTKDRRAELIGDAGNEEERGLFPTAGKSADFRAFLRDRVKPLVESRYRTNGTDAVMGESLAGLFIAETWLVEPGLFDRYAAINPSLWWHDVKLARAAESTVADGKDRGPLLVSYSNEGPVTAEGVQLMATAAGKRGCLLETGNLTHATAYHILTPQALQYLFPTEHEFEEEWGFTVDCAE